MLRCPLCRAELICIATVADVATYHCPRCVREYNASTETVETLTANADATAHLAALDAFVLQLSRSDQLQEPEVDAYLVWRAVEVQRIEQEIETANQAAAAAATAAMEDFVRHFATPEQSWAATQAALLTLVAVLDDYAPYLVRTGQMGQLEMAVYQAWRTRELQQVTAVGMRADLHDLLAEIDIEALFRGKRGGE